MPIQQTVSPPPVCAANQVLQWNGTDWALITVPISGGPSGPAQLGWHVEGLVAKNDPANQSTTMLINASFLVLYTPSTQQSDFVVPGTVPANMPCTINTVGVGGRDSATAYTAGADVWWYFIKGPAGLGTINSLNDPKTGPVLPSGYVSYAPAFVTKVFTGPSLLPVMPQGGGGSPIEVGGNVVTYENTPFIPGTGYPTMNFDFSSWVPAANVGVTIYGDIELHAGTAVIGGAVFSTALGNFENISLYPRAGEWDKGDVEIDIVLPPNRQFAVTFLHSAGIPDNAVAFVGPKSYRF